MKKFLFAAAAVLAVAACATSMSNRPMPHFTYKSYPPIQVDVANIQVVSSYVSPAHEPNVEHLMPLPLPTAVANWAHERFQAVGSDGTLVVTVKDASLIKGDLPRSEGIKRLVTVDQAEKYSGKLSVDLEVQGKSNGHDGAGSVDIARSQTIGEDASIDDRDRQWTNMEELMIQDLDSGIQKMIRARLPFLSQVGSGQPTMMQGNAPVPSTTTNTITSTPLPAAR